MDIGMIETILEMALSELGSLRLQISIWSSFISMKELEELIIRERLVREDIRRYQRELS